MIKFKFHYGFSFLLIMAFSLFSCKTADLPTVEQVDLERYAGQWHEIARLPASFQKGCSCTTADYTLMDNYVEVVNRCYDVESSKWKESKGKAKVVSGSGNSRLKVSFFWPFYGDYYIVDLDEEYRYAMVGTPSRKYLWILAREKQLDEAVKNELIQKAEDLGFDTSRLIFNAYECNP